MKLIALNSINASWLSYGGLVQAGTGTPHRQPWGYCSRSYGGFLITKVRAEPWCFFSVQVSETRRLSGLGVSEGPLCGAAHDTGLILLIVVMCVHGVTTVLLRLWTGTDSFPAAHRLRLHSLFDYLCSPRWKEGELKPSPADVESVNRSDHCETLTHVTWVLMDGVVQRSSPGSSRCYDWRWPAHGEGSHISTRVQANEDQWMTLYCCYNLLTLSEHWRSAQHPRDPASLNMINHNYEFKLSVSLWAVRQRRHRSC